MKINIFAKWSKLSAVPRTWLEEATPDAKALLLFATPPDSGVADSVFTIGRTVTLLWQLGHSVSMPRISWGASMDWPQWQHSNLMVVSGFGIPEI